VKRTTGNFKARVVVVEASDWTRSHSISCSSSCCSCCSCSSSNQ